MKKICLFNLLSFTLFSEIINKRLWNIVRIWHFVRYNIICCVSQRIAINGWQQQSDIYGHFLSSNPRLQSSSTNIDFLIYPWHSYKASHFLYKSGFWDAKMRRKWSEVDFLMFLKQWPADVVRVAVVIWITYCGFTVWWN